jgi:hypothetical protein
MNMTDEQLIANSLSMWANYVETGDMALSAIEAREQKLPYNALMVDQMKLIIRLRELSDSFKQA